MTQRKRASDFDQRILELYDGYVHGRMTKRAFLDHAAKYTVGGVTAVAVLEALQPELRPRRAGRARRSRDRHRAGALSLARGQRRGRGAAGAAGGRRGAAAGGRGRAREPRPEPLHRGRGPAARQGRLPRARRRTASPRSAAIPATTRRGARCRRASTRRSSWRTSSRATSTCATGDDTGKVGCVGFCYGGGVCNALAVAYPDLAASVPFYGRQPDVADVPAIEAPLLIHYAGLDERVNAGWPAYEAALKANGKTYEAYVYDGRQPRLPQRHDAALRRGGGDARLGPDARLVRPLPSRLSSVPQPSRSGVGQGRIARYRRGEEDSHDDPQSRRRARAAGDRRRRRRAAGGGGARQPRRAAASPVRSASVAVAGIADLPEPPDLAVVATRGGGGPGGDRRARGARRQGRGRPRPTA